MYKYFFIFITVIFFYGCNNTALSVSQTNLELDSLEFNVVEKKLNIKPPISKLSQNLLSKWFDNKIKLVGFDGFVSINIFEYKELITNIENGKKVDISFKFIVNIINPELKLSKKLEGQVSSFGELTGEFSLNEFDTVIQNTQYELIKRFGKDLKSRV